jgi:cytochrome o ubiquinol oxidase operon protein cyoD
MHEESLSQIQKKWHGSYKGYYLGFILSVVLTAASFVLVYTLVLQGYPLRFTLLGLAVAQAIVQLFFFLHLGQEEKPRWETVIFLCMAIVLIIIALGSLWIMNDLNTRLMPGMEPIL